MKKLTLITAIICLLSTTGNTQSIQKQVFGSAGDTDSIAGYQVNWTIGECITEKFTGTDFILTQGFQQPYYNTTGITETSKPDFILKVFPNPTRDYLNIEINTDAPEKFILTLSTLEGKIISEAELTSGEAHCLDLTKYSTNLMFLKILSINTKQSRTSKITKIY